MLEQHNGPRHRQALLFGASFLVLALQHTPAQAACVATGGNTFELTAGAGPFSLDSACPAAANDAVLTVTGNITGPLNETASGPNGWTLNVNNGVSISSNNDTIEFRSYATVNNFGSISAVNNNALQLEGGSFLTNNGSISALGGNAAELVGGFSQVINNGVISGASLAIGVADDGVITNNAGGVITGDLGILFFGEGSIVNAGTITGAGGAAITFSFSAANNTLELHAGSLINGIVDGGLGVDTLRLGGAMADAFDVATVGVQYQAFEVFEKTGSSVWSLTGADAVGIDWTVSDGVLRLTGADNLSAAGSAIVNGGTLDLNDFDVEIGGLSGGGGTVDLGAGTLTTGGDNASSSYAGVITGTGGLVKTGTGALGLAGANTHTGPTRIENGAIRLDAAHALNADNAVEITGGALNVNGFHATIGSLSGTGGAVELGAGALTIGGDNASTSYAGVIAGTGDLVKTGTGSFTITGANTFTGMTQIDAGSFLNNGSLAGAVMVENGGLYGGDGASGDLTVNPGGVAAPGNSIGALTVNGDVFFNDGATYLVEIDPGGASDLIAATGAATISATGTTLSVVGDPAADFPETQTFTVLTAAGGVTGTFGTVTDNLPDIDLRAVYTSDSVQLAYEQAAVATEPFPPAASTTALSPKEAHPSALMAGLEGSHLFAETLRRRGGLHAQGRDLVRLTPGFAAAKNGLWIAPLGARTDVERNGDAPGWKAATGGFAFGFERRLRDGTTIGVAGGRTQTSADVGDAEANLDAWRAGLYAAAALDNLILSGALAYADQDYDVSRIILYGGGGVVADGAAKGDSYAASGEAFYNLAPRAAGQTLKFGPAATIAAVHAARNGFVETGAGILNLTVGADDVSQVVTGLGGAFSLSRPVARTRITAEARLLWEHVAGDLQATTVSTIPLADATFVASSTPIDRNRIAAGAGAIIMLTDTLNVHARYDGAFSAGAREHRASAGISLQF